MTEERSKRQCRNRQPQLTNHERQRRGKVVKPSVSTQTGKALAIVVEAGSKGEENPRKTMRASVDRKPGQSQPGAHGNRGEWQNDQRRRQRVEHDHFVLLYFL